MAYTTSQTRNKLILLVQFFLGLNISLHSYFFFLVVKNLLIRLKNSKGVTNHKTNNDHITSIY